MSGLGPCTEACPERVGISGTRRDTCAVVVAGGSGERFGDPRGKQYVDLCGLPLACWSLIALDRSPSIGHIVVVCAADHRREMREDVISRLRLRCEVTIAEGGATRQDSVRSGLAAVPEDFGLVAIHDAARPLIQPVSVERAIACVRDDAGAGGAICAARVTDTLKLVEDASIVATPDRSFYWSAQTPQVFRTAQIVAAHKAAARDKYLGTDDASLIERSGARVVCVETPRDNLKVTLPEDLLIARALLQSRLAVDGCGLDLLDLNEGDSL